MKNKLILFALAILIVLPMVSAEPSFVFESGQDVDLNIPVFSSDNALATSSVNCNLTVKSPNSSILVRNGQMTFNAGGMFNYTIPGEDTLDLGEHPVSINCDDGADFGFSEFSYLVNPTGGSPITAGESIALVLIFGVMLIVAIFFMVVSIRSGSPPAKLGFMILSGLILIILVFFSVTTMDNILGSFSGLATSYGAFFLVFRFFILFGILMFLFFAIFVAMRLYKIKRGLLD